MAIKQKPAARETPRQKVSRVRHAGCPVKAAFRFIKECGDVGAGEVALLAADEVKKAAAVSMLRQLQRLAAPGYRRFIALSPYQFIEQDHGLPPHFGLPVTALGGFLEVCRDYGVFLFHLQAVFFQAQTMDLSPFGRALQANPRRSSNVTCSEAPLCRSRAAAG